MKTKFIVAIAFFIFPLFCISQTSNTPQIKDFAKQAFNAFKKNDVSLLENMLIKEPSTFTVNNETITLSVDGLKASLKEGFKTTLNDMQAAGIKYDEIKLMKIVIELEEDQDFDLPTLYLVCRAKNLSLKNDYFFRIKMEGCMQIGNYWAIGAPRFMSKVLSF